MLYWRDLIIDSFKYALIRWHRRYFENGEFSVDFAKISGLRGISSAGTTVSEALAQPGRRQPRNRRFSCSFEHRDTTTPNPTFGFSSCICGTDQPLCQPLPCHESINLYLCDGRLAKRSRGVQSLSRREASFGPTKHTERARPSSFNRALSVCKCKSRVKMDNFWFGMHPRDGPLWVEGLQT